MEDRMENGMELTDSSFNLNLNFEPLTVAGFETSSTTVTWALHYLSLHQEVQTSLREHISASLDLLRSDLESPQHKPLDNIILETLRLVLPVPYSERINVGEDTILPLSEPVIGKDGKFASIQIPKG